MTLSHGRYVRKRTFKNWRSPRKKKRPSFQVFALALGFTIALGGVTYYKIQQAHLKPDVIFVLGGHEEREKFAAELAQSDPSLEIWVSSGSPRDYAQKIFQHYGVEGDRLHLDYQAKDTVTNFTSVVDDFKRKNIKSVYLITSENHMQRAQIVAQIIFGSQGIAVKPLPVPSQNPPEAKIKYLRDGLRSILWVFTRETGEEWFDKNSVTVVTTKNL
ncbi:YdcF family protein [[Limnothrix rosea] IAM M-220]|uniref:YdcF family protein n=1 Tax=[Limnothrix rosea] IAM M-220 TaxID=454133 RepID=UPI00096A0C6F|nr:YdcF family protein [[Limnothrix rosea] IAM M-220]OKH11882.1 hypothetical protein NIES208_16785 [[Limnothrix rosea] IAM M-220]